MYQLFKSMFTGEVGGAILFNENGTTTSFGFELSNTDYQNFKLQINADEAQLQDADGNLMTAEEAKAFVATLP